MAINSRENGKDHEEAPAQSGAGPGRGIPDPGATGRAFVVQVNSERVEGDGTFAGRVQHLATADGGNFASPEGLLAIMRRVLQRSARRDEAGDE